MEKNTLESTNKLLQVIVGLLLRKKEDQILSLRQQIEILNDFGLKPTQIAEIIGRTPIYINKELSIIRNGIGKK